MKFLAVLLASVMLLAPLGATVAQAANSGGAKQKSASAKSGKKKKSVKKRSKGGKKKRAKRRSRRSREDKPRVIRHKKHKSSPGQSHYPTTQSVGGSGGLPDIPHEKKDDLPAPQVPQE